MKSLSAYKYYEGGTDPLISILDIPPSLVKSNYRKEFNYDSYYIKYRIEIETFIRKRFIRKGGVPKLQHPIYFLLNNIEHYKNRFENERLLTISLDELNKSALSFTIGSAFEILKSSDKRVLTYNDLIIHYPEIESIGDIEMQLWDTENIVFKEELFI